MSDSDNKEENHSLLRDEEVSGDNRSLNNSVTRFQTSQRDTLVRLIVSLTSVILIFNTIAGVIGFFVGKAMVKEQYKSNIELGSISKTFIYNETFAKGPSLQSALAWNEMFPQRGGDLSHPAIAPERSTLSVFHQLHCVDMLRLGFFKFYDAAMAGIQINESEEEMIYSPEHISHCIDLLRQSFMCHGDTTIEVKEGAEGAKGFGTTHKCRDWDQLVSWTIKWQLEDTIPPKGVLGA